MAILKYFGRAFIYLMVVLTLANVSLWAIADMKFENSSVGLA